MTAELRDGDAEPAADDRLAIAAGFTALVVEDNMLIAMDAEESLYELGAGTVQLCTDVGRALAGIAAARFDIALLDVSLGDDTSEAVAMALRARGIPFIVTTGFGDLIGGMAAFAGAPLLAKPYAPAALAEALAQILGVFPLQSVPAHSPARARAGTDST